MAQRTGIAFILMNDAFFFLSSFSLRKCVRESHLFIDFPFLQVLGSHIKAQKNKTCASDNFFSPFTAFAYDLRASVRIMYMNRRDCRESREVIYFEV